MPGRRVTRQNLGHVVISRLPGPFLRQWPWTRQVGSCHPKSPYSAGMISSPSGNTGPQRRWKVRDGTTYERQFTGTDERLRSHLASVHRPTLDRNIKVPPARARAKARRFNSPRQVHFCAIRRTFFAVNLRSDNTARLVKAQEKRRVRYPSQLRKGPGASDTFHMRRSEAMPAS
jgi:hypothetical protein